MSLLLDVDEQLWYFNFKWRWTGDILNSVNSQITVWRRARIVSLEFSWMFNKEGIQDGKKSVKNSALKIFFAFQDKLNHSTYILHI